MPFAITQTCCSDASCVSVCPVNCIHPTPEEREFGSTDMLHVDPRSCIDCGACADACPVDAIFPISELTGPDRVYAEINSAWYGDGTRDVAPAEHAEHTPAGEPVGDGTVAAGAGPTTDEMPPLPRRTRRPVEADGSESPNFHRWSTPTFERALPGDFPAIRVAVVGTGPAGMYAVQDLVLHTPAQVTLVDRLTTWGGLAKYGVAPDHPATRRVVHSYRRYLDHPRVDVQLGVAVVDPASGAKGLSHADLMAHHDAVVYAVGARGDRRLGIPGEDLPGSLPATEVVGWYTGHPDVDAAAVDVRGAGRPEDARAVVVGTGNVALDVARVLVGGADRLEGTEAAPHAVAALRTSVVREVLLLGRRGPDAAAFTVPELLALQAMPGVEVVLDVGDPATAAVVEEAAAQHAGRATRWTDKAAVLAELPRATVDWSAPPSPGRRVVLRFGSAPVEVLGADRVTGLRVTGADGGGGTRDVACGLVVRAVGHRASPVPGLPWDEATATVPHEAGRVVGVPGAYVAGWVKRGPSGGIGANRFCAQETIGTLLADAVAGRLPAPTGSPRSFARLARRAR